MAYGAPSMVVMPREKSEIHHAINIFDRWQHFQRIRASLLLVPSLQVSLFHGMTA